MDKFDNTEQIRDRQNLGWCKPIKHKSEDIYLCLMEGKVVGIFQNGKEKITITDEEIRELARRFNTDYDLYEGWDDVHILLDSGNFEELGCGDCPWRDVCEVTT